MSSPLGAIFVGLGLFAVGVFAWWDQSRREKDNGILGRIFRSASTRYWNRVGAVIFSLIGIVYVVEGIAGLF